MEVSILREAIARQRADWSLEQAFYIDPEIYEFERREWLAEQWYILGHCSEVSEPGRFIVRSVLGESLVIVRDHEGLVRAFYNLCKHRGSRLCDKDGRAQSFICPYHAWTYRLDGSLRSAPAMPKEIDLAELRLNAVPVREIGGVIIGSLKGNLRELDEVQNEAEPLLRYQGIPQARVAARRSYRTYANWKLVMENFKECYHCLPCHPEYCGVMRHVDVVARQATPEAEAVWKEEEERWFREQADAHSPAHLRRWDPKSQSRWTMSRGVIGKGFKTESQDGEPVAPLMGQLQRFDGGFTGFGIRPFVVVIMPNDHALMFQFLPMAVEETEVIISWLVDGSASDSDVDLERLVWLWDVTTIQDKAIIERNAAGIRSHAYVPGPYSLLEAGPAQLVSAYLRELSAKCSDQSV